MAIGDHTESQLSGSPASPGEPEPSPGFWKTAMVRFRKNRLALFAARTVMFLAMIALFADFLAYQKPLVCEYNGKTYYPLVYDYLSEVGLYQWEPKLILAEWREMELDGTVTNAFWPPIRYAPGELDYANQRLLSPFDNQIVPTWKHWHYFGTDREGRDILSGLIHGTRISLTIGLVAVGIAAVIGIFLGAMAGYFGDRRLQLSRIGILFLILGLFLGYFYGFQVRTLVLKEALAEGTGPIVLQTLLSILIMVGSTIAMLLLAKPLEYIPWLGKKKYLWIDIFVSRAIEIWSSIPALLLLITISALTEENSIGFLMIVLGLFSWPGIARFLRGEILRTRSQMYIEAARSMGFSEMRVLFRHTVPNSLAPVLVVIAFGIAGAIVAEASLSFLGIGVPEEVITWGGLLREANQDLSAWWLSLFPGLAIFITVTSLNLVGEGLRDALDPRTNDQ